MQVDAAYRYVIEREGKKIIQAPPHYCEAKYIRAFIRDISIVISTDIYMHSITVFRLVML